MSIEAYKLMRLRKNGTLGPLFIDAKAVIPVDGGSFLRAKAVRKKGFKFRPGWHTVSKPYAPHLSKKGRVWVRVLISEYEKHQRPAHQGGLWYTSNWMLVKEILWSQS